MAYSEAAIARRRCTVTRKDGAACRSWACWDDPHQRCAQHAGRVRGGLQWLRSSAPRTRPPACRCAAYRWPHRPGAGLCRWPEQPTATSATPAGTRGGHRVRFRLRVRDGGRVSYERR